MKLTSTISFTVMAFSPVFAVAVPEPNINVMISVPVRSSLSYLSVIRFSLLSLLSSLRIFFTYILVRILCSGLTNSMSILTGLSMAVNLPSATPLSPFLLPKNDSSVWLFWKLS